MEFFIETKMFLEPDFHLIQTQYNLDTGTPLNDLTPEAVAWCRSVGCQASTLSDILNNNDETMMKAIQEGMDR